MRPDGGGSRADATRTAALLPKPRTRPVAPGTRLDPDRCRRSPTARSRGRSLGKRGQECRGELGEARVQATETDAEGKSNSKSTSASRQPPCVPSASSATPRPMRIPCRVVWVAGVRNSRLPVWAYLKPIRLSNFPTPIRLKKLLAISDGCLL